MAVATPWVLLCKPVRAPFRDGTSVLVRNMLQGMVGDVELVYFGDPQAPVRNAGDRVLEATAMSYQPTTADKLRMFAQLLGPGLVRLPIHSFFAANANSSRALELLRRLPRRRRVLQTLPASTGATQVAGMLKRLDGVVVTSDWGRRMLIDAGLEAQRVQRIYPGVGLPESISAPPLAQRRSLLFAGDLDPDVGERLITVAHMLERAEGWRLEIATRPKGEGHQRVLERLQTELAPALAADRVRILGEVSSMAELYDRATLQLYLASHARKKVDIPFVLLEGMARGVPVAILDADPVRELLLVAAEAQTEIGLSLAPDNFSSATEALGELLADADRIERMGAGARTLVAQRFSSAEMAAAYHRTYETLS